MEQGFFRLFLNSSIQPPCSPHRNSVLPTSVDPIDGRPAPELEPSAKRCPAIPALPISPKTLAAISCRKIAAIQLEQDPALQDGILISQPQTLCSLYRLAGPRSVASQAKIVTCFEGIRRCVIRGELYGNVIVTIRVLKIAHPGTCQPSVKAKSAERGSRARAFFWLANASSFFIGRDSRGNWVVQDEQRLCGGLFVDRAEAVRFALFENGNRPQAVIMVPGEFELDMSGCFASAGGPRRCSSRTTGGLKGFSRFHPIRSSSRLGVAHAPVHFPRLSGSWTP